MKPLAYYLRNPNDLDALNEVQWDCLLRQAQSARLHGTLAALAPARGYAPAVTRALASAKMVASANHRAVKRELSEIKKIFAPLQIPMVALKGAAYVLHDIPFARARFVTDVDILVPRASLHRVEDALKFAGFSSGKHHAYDQKYYRKWMHEIPPLQHIKRGSTLDVHHHILPLTARAAPDIDLLWQELVSVSDDWHTPCAYDMILHSMLHLFFDGEWDHALRDLWDMHQLIGHFATSERFWLALRSRADAQKLTQVLAWAMPVICHYFATPAPPAWLQELSTVLPKHRPNTLMHRVFIEGSSPDHASVRTAKAVWARRALYIRGHYLRMPLHLLVPHLLRKSFRRPEEASAEV